MALACPPLIFHLVHFSLQQCLICLQDVDTLVTLHAPNNVPHQICRSCCSYLITYNTPKCPTCRSPVDLFQAHGIPFCSECNLEHPVPHCFNPNCLTGPNSTPVCNPCSYTLYFLTNPICPSCHGPRPIPYVDLFVMASVLNLR